MIKQHDILAIFAVIVSFLLGIWLLVQLVETTFVRPGKITSEHLGGVIHLGDRITNADR